MTFIYFLVFIFLKIFLQSTTWKKKEKMECEKSNEKRSGFERWMNGLSEIRGDDR